MAEGSHLIGGHSLEVQVGVAAGWVESILSHVAVHVVWGRLRQELV